MRQHTTGMRGRASKLPRGGWAAVLGAAGLVIMTQGALQAAPQLADAELDRGAAALDPATRAKLLIPFDDGLWVPDPKARPVSMSDAEMNVVGTTEAMRIYALSPDRANGPSTARRLPGGGGGAVVRAWRGGEVYVRVAPGRYWPLVPAAQAPAPSRPETRPAPRP